MSTMIKKTQTNLIERVGIVSVQLRNLVVFGNLRIVSFASL